MIPKKILIVDDEEDLLLILSERLKNAGYLVSTASNGLEGLGRVMTEKPDLVILDVTMPKMDGWQVLKRLREGEETRELPVIMLTAKGDMNSLDEGTRQKATDYFIKPYEIEELLTFIRKYI